MIIKKHGLELRSLLESDLDMIRTWRNKERVREHMQFQSVVSTEDQIRWFNSLDPDQNVYWVFAKNGIDIGLVYIKNIQNGEYGEAGIFTGLDNYLGTPVPALAILTMMDIAFDVLGLPTLKAKIQTNNNRNIWTNLKFGYQPDNTADQSDFAYYSVDRSQFLQATAIFRSVLLKLYGNQTTILDSENEKGLLKRSVELLRAKPTSDRILFF